MTSKRMWASTTFTVGDRVRSRIDAQGMRADEEFVVAGVRVRATPWGDFVTYEVRNAAGGVTSVVNGHVVLERAEEVRS